MRNGKLTGQSILARDGDSCVYFDGMIFDDLELTGLSGTIRLSQVQAKYTASVPQDAISREVSVTVDEITIAIKAEKTLDTCEFTMSQYDVLIGNVQELSIGEDLAWLGTGQLIGLATSRATYYMYSTIYKEIPKAVWTAINNNADLQLWCSYFAK